MTKHEHDWTLAHSLKADGETILTYRCVECNESKTEKGELIKNRLSNMGGKFSTNWKA